MITGQRVTWKSESHGKGKRWRLWLEAALCEYLTRHTKYKINLQEALNCVEHWTQWCVRYLQLKSIRYAGMWWYRAVPQPCWLGAWVLLVLFTATGYLDTLLDSKTGWQVEKAKQIFSVMEYMMCPNTEIAGWIPKLLVAPMPVSGLWIMMVASPILKGAIIMSSAPPDDSEGSVTMGTQHSLLSVAAMRSQHQHFNGRWGLTITSHKLTTISASLQIIMIITVTW